MPSDLLAPFILLFWADATFWIPLLLVLFTWKHVWRARPLRYSAELWSIVFPMGMYAAATQQFIQTFGISFLDPAVQIMFWAALVLWSLSVIGMALHAAGFNPQIAA